MVAIGWIYVLTDFDDVPVAGAASVLGFGWIFPVRRIKFPVITLRELARKHLTLLAVLAAEEREYRKNRRNSRFNGKLPDGATGQFSP